MAQEVIKKAEEGDKVVKLADMVTFKAGKGSKYMKEGKTYRLHRLHAERLVAKKLGSIEGKA